MAKTIEEYDFSFTAPGQEVGHGTLRYDLPEPEGQRDLPRAPGVGKTHLAIALAIKACYHGFRCTSPQCTP